MAHKHNSRLKLTTHVEIKKKRVALTNKCVEINKTFVFLFQFRDKLLNYAYHDRCQFTHYDCIDWQNCFGDSTIILTPQELTLFQI